MPGSEPASRAIRLGLAGSGLAVAIGLGLDRDAASILAIAAVQGMVFLVVRRARNLGAPPVGEGWRKPGRIAGMAPGLAILSLAWMASTRMVWWAPMADWVRSSPRATVALIASLVIVSANLARVGSAVEGRRPRLLSPINVAALVVLALASLRVDTLGVPASSPALQAQGALAFHHWGAIVGGAELVRSGGWLLWDVPSQYGFLNALLVAAVPVENGWQAFYLVNAALLFLTGAFLFLVLRGLRSGPLNLPFALGVTLAAVFMIPGWPESTMPAWPHVTPAVGPYRFFWCFAMLAVLILEWRAEPRPDSFRKVPALGCVAWLLGTLWSCESAAYCAVIWGPDYLVMARRRAVLRFPGPEGRGARARMMAAWAAGPPLLLAVAAGGISLDYVARLGHPPDWRAFADYVIGMSVFALPIDPGGIVLALVLAFCILSVLVAGLARAGGRESGALALALGAWGVLWSGSSCFIGRSHEVNGSNISPLVIAALAVGLLLVRRGRPGVERIAGPVGLATAPILVALLTLSFGVDGQVERQVDVLRRGYRQRVERLLPEADPALAELIDAAGVRPREPIAMANDDLGLMPAVRVGGPGTPLPRSVVLHEGWTVPFVLAAVLPFDRQEEYIRRRAERSGGGWLAFRKDVGINGPYRDMHLKYYRPTASFENERWQLSRLESDAVRR